MKHVDIHLQINLLFLLWLQEYHLFLAVLCHLEVQTALLGQIVLSSQAFPEKNFFEKHIWTSDIY